MLPLRSSVNNELEQSDEESSFLQPESSSFKATLCYTQSHHSVWKWKLANCVLLLFQVVMLVYLLVANKTSPENHGLASELYSAREAIKYHDVVFTSGIEEKPDGKLYMHLPENEPAYVGQPSKEIDAAWANLTQATEIWVNGTEAKGVAGLSISSNTSWLVSLDVYHSLHCVNLARKGLDWNYYYGDQEGQEAVNYLTKDHIYHCLEHLRQVVMCHSDLTPMMFRWSSIKEGRGMPVWDSPRTCRDFGLVKAWAEARKREFTTPLDMGHHH